MRNTSWAKRTCRVLKSFLAIQFRLRCGIRLAAKDNLEFYRNELLGAEKQMTADQVAKGKGLAAAWRPKVAEASLKASSPQQHEN